MILSGNKKKWQVIDRSKRDILEQLLANRNIPDSVRDDFLKPDFDSLGDPFLLKDMGEVVGRLIKVKDNREMVGIFGDYDADGITSATLLGKIMAALDIKYSVYIPSREEGYGLNRLGIDKFKRKKVSLLIAVDMGITGKVEIDYAQSLGMDTIIIDHHLVQEDKLPVGFIINPRQIKDKYVFKDFSACGLVFKLAQAISTKYPELISRKDLKWWLDLVAISTVADMVPLVGENRILAYFGLIVMAKTRLVGLKSIYKTAGIDPEKLNSGVIGFKIAPRLNAPGRIINAEGAYALLNEGNMDKALDLAREVNDKNILRQRETERIIGEVKSKINKNNIDKNKVILVSGHNWPTGLIGIVAGRIMEEYNRPTIILNEMVNVAKGSARSIEKYHLLKSFEYGSEFLDTFGGHARAGGLGLDIKNIKKFYSKLLDYADEALAEEDLIPKIKVDMALTLSEINLELIKKIEKLEPYGFGNPRPVFVLRSQKVSLVSRVGKDRNHLKLKFSQLDSIYFNGASERNLLPKINDIIDVVFSLNINVWNNQENISLNIIDWHLSDSKRKAIK